MRLVVLTAAYPAPSEPERAVFIENLTLSLAAAAPGAPITVVAPQVGPADPLFELRQGLAVRRFPYRGGGKRLKEIDRPPLSFLGAYAFSALAVTLECMRRSAADCLLCHWLLPAGPVAAAASALLGVPFVAAAHGSDLNVYARSSRAALRLARWTLGRAARVLAVSEDLKRALVSDFGVPAGKAALLRMGIDPERFAPAAGDADSRQALGLDPGIPVLLYVGDLIETKGVADLLEAWRLLRRGGVAAQLCLVGSGPLEKLAAEAARNGDGRRVRLAGRRPQEELSLWYRAADLFILPSRGEGAPVSVMEALSSGVPVVASRVGGVPELVEDGRTGCLVPPRDAPALAAAIAGLLQDRERLARLRRHVAELPRRAFSVSERGRELALVLEEVSRGA